MQTKIRKLDDKHFYLDINIGKDVHHSMILHNDNIDDLIKQLESYKCQIGKT